MSPGFDIVGGKGFHITFKNNHTISVQFGGGMHCHNQHAGPGYRGHCPDAEVATWGPDGTWSTSEVWSKVFNKDLDGDATVGYISPNDVAAVIAYLAALP